MLQRKLFVVHIAPPGHN